MNIDQALIALCRKHDLRSISVGPKIVEVSEYIPLGYYFDATVFWTDGDGCTRCSSSHGDTSEEAISAAISKANALRPVSQVAA